MHHRENNINSTAPGQIKVIKRNGKMVSYDESKIKVAITKTFLAVEGGSAAASNRIHETVSRLANQISKTFKRRLPTGGTVHIEDVQDQVELSLCVVVNTKLLAHMYFTEKSIAHYAEEETKRRIKKQGDVLYVTLANGSHEPLDKVRIETIVKEACINLKGVEVEPVIKDALRNLFNMASITDVHKALVMSARTAVEKEPNYTYVAARLLMDSP